MKEATVNSIKALITILLVIAIWQVFLKSTIIPPPLEVLISFLASIKDGYIFIDALTSIKRVFTGFLIASLVGISLGVVLSLNKRISPCFTPLIELVRPIPPVAWIPIAILWFGLGDPSAYFLVALGAFFPIFTNTYDGINNMQNIHLRTARNFGAKLKHIIYHILLPGALPSIFTGLKTGMGIAWIIVITAELVGATSGLGYMIQLSRLNLDTANIIMGMIVIGIIGFFMNKLILLFEKKIIPWREHEER